MKRISTQVILLLMLATFVFTSCSQSQNENNNQQPIISAIPSQDSIAEIFDQGESDTTNIDVETVWIIMKFEGFNLRRPESWDTRISDRSIFCWV